MPRLMRFGFETSKTDSHRYIQAMPDTIATHPDLRTDDVTELVRRRAEIRGEIARGRRDLRRLASESQRIDAALRELKGAEAPAASRSSVPDGAGELTRIVFDTLNEATAPMTSRTLALRVMEELGLDASDKSLVKYVVRRVCVCLWMQVQKGYFRKAEPEGGASRWERVPTAQ